MASQGHPHPASRSFGSAVGARGPCVCVVFFFFDQWVLCRCGVSGAGQWQCPLTAVLSTCHTGVTALVPPQLCREQAHL